MRVTVVGLGYVGMTASAMIAHQGHQVLGVDIAKGKVQDAQVGHVGFYEPGLGDMLRESLDSGRLAFAHADQVKGERQDVVIVAVGTPSMPSGAADMSQVKAAVRWAVATSMKPPVIVMKSSVPPGTGGRIVAQELGGAEQLYVSNPEFLREGSAVHDWLHPARIVIGGQSPEAIDRVEELYSSIEAPVLRTDITSAEMIKYASNALLVTKISFINEIAMLCEAVDGHIDDVTRGLALDPRIGPAFLGPGVGWGGSCFPKDVRALEFLASQNGNTFELLRAVISVNERQRLLPVQALRENFEDLKDLPVAVLGLAFKPGTDDLRDAPALTLISALVEEGVRVSAYDPVAVPPARALVPQVVNLTDNPLEALAGSKAAILVTEWPQVLQLPWEEVGSLMGPPRFIFDGRNALDGERLASIGFRYRGVGRMMPGSAPRKF